MSIELAPLNYPYHPIPADFNHEEEIRAARYSPEDGTYVERRPLSQRQVNYGGVNEVSRPLQDKILSSAFNLTCINKFARNLPAGQSIALILQPSIGIKGAFQKILGGVQYFAIRNLVRTSIVLPLRILGLIGGLIASACTGKSKFAIESGKLVGLSLLRVFITPLQLLLFLASCVVVLLTLGHWEHSYKLSKLTAEIDSYFDQWECSIDSAYEENRYISPDALKSDQLFLPFRHPNPDIELDRVMNYLGIQENPEQYQAMLQENRAMVEAHAEEPNPPIRNLHDMADVICQGDKERNKFEYHYVAYFDQQGKPTQAPTISYCKARGLIVTGDPVIEISPPLLYKNPPEDDELESIS